MKIFLRGVLSLNSENVKVWLMTWIGVAVIMGPCLESNASWSGNTLSHFAEVGPGSDIEKREDIDDNTTKCRITMDIWPVPDYEITSVNTPSHWVDDNISGIVVTCHYDYYPANPECAYSGKWHGKLEYVGEPQGGGGGGGPSPEPEFDVEAKGQAAEFEIRSPDHSSPYMVCIEDSITFKSWLVGDIGDTAPASCDWQISQGNNSATIEDTQSIKLPSDLPACFSDDDGNPQPAKYDITAKYECSELNETLTANEEVTLVQLSLKKEVGLWETFPIQESGYKVKFTPELTPNFVSCQSKQYSVDGNGTVQTGPAYDRYIPPDMNSPGDNTETVMCTCTLSGGQVSDEQDVKVWAVPSGGWSVEDTGSYQVSGMYGGKLKQNFNGTGGDFKDDAVKVEEVCNTITRKSWYTAGLEADGDWRLDSSGKIKSFDAPRIGGLEAYCEDLNTETYLKPENNNASIVLVEVSQEFEWQVHGRDSSWRTLSGAGRIIFNLTEGATNAVDTKRVILDLDYVEPSLNSVNVTNIGLAVELLNVEISGAPSQVTTGEVFTVDYCVAKPTQGLANPVWPVTIIVQNAANYNYTNTITTTPNKVEKGTITVQAPNTPGTQIEITPTISNYNHREVTAQINVVQ